MRRSISLTSDTLTADLCGSEELKLEDIDAFDLVTDLARRANLLRPTLKKCFNSSHNHNSQEQIRSDSPMPPTSLASSSMGCLSAVMSLKVQRNSTTMSRSFLIGEMCIRSQSGVPATQSAISEKISERNQTNIVHFIKSLSLYPLTVLFVEQNFKLILGITFYGFINPSCSDKLSIV